MHSMLTDVLIPDDVLITPASPHLPAEIIAFFGTTGKWRGTWKSPQVKGGFDAVLTVEELGEGKADVVYIVPDYPPWLYRELHLAHHGRAS